MASVVMLVLHAGGTQGLGVPAFFLAVLAGAIVVSMKEKGKISEEAYTFFLMGAVAFFVASWHILVALALTLFSVCCVASVLKERGGRNRR